MLDTAPIAPERIAGRIFPPPVPLPQSTVSLKPLYQWGEMCWRYVPPVHVLVAGIGDRTFSEFETLLAEEYNCLKPHVLDIRSAPHGGGGWNEEVMEARIKRYTRLPSWTDVASDIEHVHDFNGGLDQICTLMEYGFTPLLLCSCADANSCHRSRLQQRLEEMGLSVREFFWKWRAEKRKW